MAMPGAIETRKHYASLHSFRQDECEMVRNGWTTEGFIARAVKGSRLSRLLRREPSQEVDAHYLRADWLDEA